MGEGVPVRAADVLAASMLAGEDRRPPGAAEWAAAEAVADLAALSEAAGGGDFAVVDGVLMGSLARWSDPVGHTFLRLSPVLGEATDGD